METTKQFLMQCISHTRKKNLLVALGVKNEREREREIHHTLHACGRCKKTESRSRRPCKNPMISNLYRGLRGCSSASCFHDLLSSTFGVAGMISDSAERKEKGVGSSMLTADSNGAGVEFRDDLALLAIEIRATFN
jgi:hypothetical protein